MGASNVSRQVRFEALRPEQVNYRLTEFGGEYHEQLTVYPDNSGERYIRLNRELSDNGIPVPGNVTHVTKSGLRIFNNYEAIAFDGAAPCAVSRYKVDTCVPYSDSFTQYQSEKKNSCYLESFYQCDRQENVLVGEVGRHVVQLFPQLATLSAQYYSGLMAAVVETPSTAIEMRATRRLDYSKTGEETKVCTIAYHDKAAISADDRFWQAWNNPLEWFKNGQFPVIDTKATVAEITISDEGCDGVTDYADARWIASKAYFEVGTRFSPPERSGYVSGILRYFDPFFKDRKVEETEWAYAAKPLVVLTWMGATVRKGDLLFAIQSSKGPLAVRAEFSGVVQELSFRAEGYLYLKLSSNPTGQ